ncbi:transcriptional regulator with XRE-family HTH domain [Aneurinibacillus soli]|uniref:HTH-type transcriptional regulator Xre n=1 Tax=Aneurinibacillus soli TaxID=1500254 RepID=A0A0U5BNF2_9BACL|nr:helix-turn-helix domain-containing protein [Aneurinibacillus soli]PYE61925.1 transcriptional regulator with XRE-family HTH domain [Aneurinibacillus soli]BAU29742.1 HTH-type transcriptional regulator Xre [Aneurinibacillus soli]
MKKYTGFGQHLIKLRKEQGKVQKDVARAISVHRAAYASYELGRREPCMDTIVKLARYFEVSCDYLLLGESITNNREDISVVQKNIPANEPVLEVTIRLKGETKALGQEELKNILNLAEIFKVLHYQKDLDRE